MPEVPVPSPPALSGGHLEACRLDSLIDIRRVHHVGQPVALLNLLLDPLVFCVATDKLVGEAPLVAGKGASGFENPKDLRVYALSNGGVARRLDGIHPVERVVREGELHKVTLDGLALAGEALPLVEGVAPLHLILVEGDASDVPAREAGCA